MHDISDHSEKIIHPMGPIANKEIQTLTFCFRYLIMNINRNIKNGTKAFHRTRTFFQHKNNDSLEIDPVLTEFKHTQLPIPNIIYTCNWCNFKSHVRNILQQHIKTKHDTEQNFLNPKMERTLGKVHTYSPKFKYLDKERDFDTWLDKITNTIVSNHTNEFITTKHTSMMVKTEAKHNSNTNQYTNGLNHVENRDNILDEANEKVVLEKHACDKCDYRASQHHNLKKHKESIHEGLKYQCTRCDYKATLRASLVRHTRSIHDGATYSCEICDMNFSTLGNLKSHKIVRHDGEKKYKCGICSYKANRQRCLFKHNVAKHNEIIESSIGPTLHKQKTQDGVRYCCDMCSYTGNTQGGFYTHKKDHHGLQPTKTRSKNPGICDQCGHETKTNHEMTTHMKHKHKSIQ